MACLLLVGAVAAQDAPSTLPRETATVRSGDRWTDRRLDDINAYAARYPDAFADELVRYFDAPRELVENSISAKRTQPADVYYACAIARVAGQPCRGVLEAWQRARAEGWAPVAARHGVVAGTEQAARVRELIEGSYRRWARPPPDTSGQAGGPGKPAAVDG